MAEPVDKTLVFSKIIGTTAELALDVESRKWRRLMVTGSGIFYLAFSAGLSPTSSSRYRVPADRPTPLDIAPGLPLYVAGDAAGTTVSFWINWTDGPGSSTKV